jgi:hypothetical protein
MDATTNTKIAEELKRLAKNTDQWERQGQEFAAERWDKTAALTFRDCEDLRNIAKVIEAGDYGLAKQLIDNLDTIPRSQVPHDLRNLLVVLGR